MPPPDVAELVEVGDDAPPTVSVATLAFCRELLLRQQLAVGSEDFERLALTIMRARRELDAAIAAATRPQPAEVTDLHSPSSNGTTTKEPDSGKH